MHARTWTLGLVGLLLLGCSGVLDGEQVVAEEGTDEAAEEVAVDEGTATEEGAVVEHDNKGVRIAGENGVLVGDQAEAKGVRVGGEYGVMAGKDETSTGVRVGGSKGVVVGKDEDTTGVRVGGDKGVEIDGKKGISIGGKKLFGKKK